MKRALIVAAKDFRSLVTSPIFFIIAGASTLLMSYSYIRVLEKFAQQSMMSAMQFGGESGANIHMTVFMSHISITNLLFVFVAPALTMRLLAEEKKMRTYDLLLTSPLTATDIALGKFLAGYGAALVLVFISMLYPLGTRFLAEYNMPMLLTSYAGLAFVVGAYVAVGVFSSALTESVMLSVVIGLIFNLFLWFLGQGSDLFTDTNMVAVMEHMSIGQHFGNFVRGTPKLSSLVFFFSCMGFFVFLTQRVVESSRWR